MNETSVLWEETIHGGATWSHVLKRGTALGITDLQGGGECRRSFLQLRVSCGKVQHAGYTQGAAYRPAYQRILCCTPTWAESSAPLSRIRLAGTIRSAEPQAQNWRTRNTGLPAIRSIATTTTRTVTTLF